VALDHGAHGAVEDEDALVEQGVEQFAAVGLHVNIESKIQDAAQPLLALQANLRRQVKPRSGGRKQKTRSASWRTGLRSL